MDRLNRRDALKVLGTVPVAAGVALTEAEAQHAHQQAQTARQTARRTGAAFKPKFFTQHEYATVRILADMIIPADERSGSASDAGVPEFMDFIMIDMPARQVPMRGGLAWLDHDALQRFDRTFADCTPAQRGEIVDAISGIEEDPARRQGQAFFRNFRDLTSSGFWTSRMGIKDLAYIGNTFVPEWTGCPREALAKLGLDTAD
ncbi:MAG TPA: gluconate 2-dehydrogenase subunit 3 family protein [Vicinamibacterales bacterium]|nr:gluconate 2-dehydrogenase subunit 3 family protein [Vicinamibacterales bacterium]